jgi:hypothetical protein
MRAVFVLGLVLAAPAHAQPIADPEPLPPLAQIRDDRELARALVAITEDPSVRVDEPVARRLAHALMTEAVRQLQMQSYEQALANFLEAYNLVPSPTILLNIASTLRDMGRLADAANTYVRFLADPATPPQRVADTKDKLERLDAQLTILTVRVASPPSEISIDAGPFVAASSSLVTRVRPGLHLVRVTSGSASEEITVNGFAGEAKEVPAVENVGARVEGPAAALPDHVDGWLITGTQYSAASPSGRQRRVRSGYGGLEVAAILPKLETADPGEAVVQRAEPHISSGLVGLMRIDGEGRGAAAGLGVAYTPEDHVELELDGLRSQVWGAYAGGRYRFRTGRLRPYAGVGMPLFFFTDQHMQSRVAIGVRAAGGVELQVHRHLSIAADLGVEYFLNVSDSLYMNHPIDSTVFAPTLGVIGRL